MKISVTSHRGHDEAVMDVGLSEKVFDKLTGKTNEPIDRGIVPESLKELTALFSKQQERYIAAAKVGEELQVVHFFNPNVEEMVFFAPVVGG